jgi:hypothetical protein
MDFTPQAVIRALETLSAEHNVERREELLNAGLKEMVKWFTLAAKIILQKKIQLPKQTQKFMDRHKEDIQLLSDGNVALPTKRKLILKPGGSGFLGGVMIRSLLRWDGKKTARKFSKDPLTQRKPRKSAKKKSQPRQKSKKAKTTRKSRQKAKKTKEPRMINEQFITIRRKKKPPVVSPVSSTPRIQHTPLLASHSPVRNSPIPIPSQTPDRQSQGSPISLMRGFQTPSPQLTPRSNSLTPRSTLSTPQIRRSMSRTPPTTPRSHRQSPVSPMTPRSTFSTPQIRRSMSRTPPRSHRQSPVSPRWVPNLQMARFSPLTRVVSTLRQAGPISYAAQLALDALSPP